MSGTLIIDKVNLELLEKQRLLLAAYLMNTEEKPDTETMEALDGILNMLDEWSDRRDAENGVGQDRE